MRRFFIVVFCFFLSITLASSMEAQKRRAVRSPSPAIEPAPFPIALSVTPAGAVAGWDTRVISQFGYVPMGTYVEKRVWAAGVVVVDTTSTINNPGPADDPSLWWGVVHEGPIPSNWEYAELLVAEPNKPTKRAFVTFNADRGVTGTTRVATLDVVGGIRLDGFFLYRPVVVAPLALTAALKSEGADYNYFRLDESDVKQGRTAVVGMILTVCKTVEVFGIGVVDLNNRQCITGTVGADHDQ